MTVEAFRDAQLAKIAELKQQSADNQTQTAELIGHEHEEVMTTFDELKRQIGNMEIPDEIANQVIGALEDAKSDLAEKNALTKEAVGDIFDAEA